jgi:ABC-type uncharacterized transport system substrate-binding protein
MGLLLLAIALTLPRQGTAQTLQPATPAPRDAVGGGQRIKPPPRPMPRVVILRKPGIWTYEKVAEEFRGRVRGSVRLLQAQQTNALEILSWIQSFEPSLVFAIGQSAYELGSQLKDIPLIHTLAFHTQECQLTALHAGPPLAEVLIVLQRAFPKARRVGLLLGPDHQARLPAAREAAAERGLDLRVIEAATPARAVSALRQASGQLDALVLLPDLAILQPLVFQYALVLQSRHRIPLIGATRRHAAQGALMALDYDPQSLGRIAAVVANQILTGQQPRPPRLPPLQLTLNVNTAQRIGVSIEKLWDQAVQIYH